MKIFRNYLKLLRHIQEEQGNSWYTSASLISSKYRRDGDVLLPCSQFLLFLGYKENNEELQAQLVSKSLEEGRTLMEEVKHWKLESEAIKTVLDNGNASAQKMTSHGEVTMLLFLILILPG